MTRQSVTFPVYDARGSEWTASANVSWDGTWRVVELLSVTRDGLEMLFDDWADICTRDAVRSVSNTEDRAVEVAIEKNRATVDA